MNVDLIDLAYIGGLIDADGHVGLHKVEEGRYCPSLSFVNTDRDLVELFQKYLNGNIYIKHSKNKNWSPTYEIIVRNKSDLVKAADLIEPYLRIKKNRLILARKYSQTMLDNAGYHKVPESVLKEREEIVRLWKETKIGM